MIFVRLILSIALKTDTELSTRNGAMFQLWNGSILGDKCVAQAVTLQL